MKQLWTTPKATNKRQIGNHYEALAKRHLTQQGLIEVADNFNAKCGEIDLIMRDLECIVFIEVKYRQNRHFGLAQEMVTASKARKLQKTATLWLMNQGLSPYTTEFRFDIVAIHNNGHDINWIQNAITQG
ncbi:YraN family protein [Vibrio hippocampi]|uniref:UPF0102 protein VHP8226_02432 n=1 Tax=Vibrio hippocampi TaxID=654686 RepID=A0ABM8ZJK7_9VIBR|nr:YraN family protein [Vibrio hippocampi]CAH0527089.1 hypothetical protein VHP8226_02432 [Vibrio hippocampi]